MTSFRKFIVLACALSVLLATDAADAKRRHRRRHRSRQKRAIINEPVLYERMGGSKFVTQLVDEWMRAALADGRLNNAFGDVHAKPDLVISLRKNLNQQLCELADGPCTSKPNAKRPPPDIMDLNDDQFLVLSDHLVQTMEKNKMREREKNELLGRLGGAFSGDNEPEEFGEM